MEGLLRVRYDGQKKAFFCAISKTVIQNTFRKFLREALVQNRVQTSVLGGNNILEKALHWLMYNEAKNFLKSPIFPHWHEL